MEISLDDIGYGNPTLEQVTLMSRVTIIDPLYEELSKITPPANSSEITQTELSNLVEYTSVLAKDNELLKRYEVYDKSLVDYFKNTLVSAGMDKEKSMKVVDDIIQDINPLLMRLKYHYLRARPFQIALYYRLKLFPFDSSSASTPSYPSGHAFQAKVLAEVLGNMNPKFYRSYQKICDDICMSRLSMGLHYQSDIDMGMYCAELALGFKDFKLKYKL